MATRVETPQSTCAFGLARGDITPPVGIYHRMWGAAAHDQSTGIHRPLTATALVVGPPDDTAAGLVIVALDHCLLWGADMVRLRKEVAARASIALDRLLVTFSHTHAAGLMDPNRADRPGGDLIAPYLATMTERLGTLVVEARSRAQRANLAYGSGHCSVAAHRDYFDEAGGRIVCGFNPDGPADDTVLVVRVTDESGELLATIVNYACHPTTLAWQNTLISPDYPGAMRELVERETGVPCVFLQGASGDLGPRDGYVADTAVADRNGRQLGYAALAILEGLGPPRTRFEYAGAVESGAVLGTWRHVPLDAARLASTSRWEWRHLSVDLPFRADLPTVEATNEKKARWEAEGEAALARGDRQRTAECRALVERMDRQLTRIADLPPGPNYPFAVHVLKTGDAVWVGIEGEAYQYLQVELRRRFPESPIVVVTLVNGWRADYLPTAETYGRKVYQQLIAILAPGCLEQLTDAIAVEIDAVIARGSVVSPPHALSQ